MQRRVALWITEAFYTSPLWEVEAIASLILINFLLDKHHSKKAILHHMATCHFTSKQCLKVKSPIVNTNNCLNQILLAFDILNKELSSSFCLVSTFPNHFSFYLANYKDVNARITH